jgi:hypothetical protein
MSLITLKAPEKARLRRISEDIREAFHDHAETLLKIRAYIAEVGLPPLPVDKEEAAIDLAFQTTSHYAGLISLYVGEKDAVATMDLAPLARDFVLARAQNRKNSFSHRYHAEILQHGNY